MVTDGQVTMHHNVYHNVHQADSMLRALVMLLIIQSFWSTVCIKNILISSR